MNKNVKTAIIKYGVTTAIAGGIAYLYVAMREFSISTLVEKYRILCDAFTIPGLVLVMVGILLAISNEGAYDGITYLFSYAIKALFFLRKQERYYDYVEKKRGKRVHGYGFLFVVGGVFLAAALLFLILFYVEFNKTA